MRSQPRTHPQLLVNNAITRVVVGPGAVGLFLAYSLKKEWEQENLFICHQSPRTENVVIVQGGKAIPFSWPPTFFIHNTEFLKTAGTTQKIAFYLCAPPQATTALCVQLANILAHMHEVVEHVFFVFLNNGLVLPEHENILRTGAKHPTCQVHVVRAIVAAGFVAHTQPTHTRVTHTCGQKIFYGFFKHPCKNKMPFLFPRKFFQWIFEKNIDVLEKGKFALNLILGLCVGPHTRPNGALYACVRKEEIEKFIHAFCHVMFETPQKVQHKVMELFFETLKNTWQNTNSVSLAWSQGNTKPVLYFVNTMKDSLKNTTHSLQAQFITEFLAIYEKKQNLSTQDSL